jgi:predicted RNase H-like nuclease (RuvC/YqgF family)
VQIFPGFESSPIADIAPSADSGPPSGESIPYPPSQLTDSGNDMKALSDQISSLKARFREIEMERDNLIEPIAALNEHLPNQLTVDCDVDYLRQKIEDLIADANGVREERLRSDGLLKARAARRAGG